jgi:hypothetical protein
MNSRKMQEDRLKKQLKVLNSFPICKHAIQMDLQIKKLKVAEQLKELSSRLDAIANQPEDERAKNRHLLEEIRSELFMLKRSQNELVMGGFD